MIQKELDKLLKSHQEWRQDLGGDQLRLSRENLNGLDFSGMDLSFAIIAECSLVRVNLIGTKSRGATFIGSYLMGSDLSESDHNGSCFSFCELDGADFGDSVIRGCDFRESSLKGCKFKNTDLFGAIGNMKNIKTLFLDQVITYTSEKVYLRDGSLDIKDALNYDLLPASVMQVIKSNPAEPV
jgi:uncharacterized protein YjbI with pentapeptide repeats